MGNIIQGEARYYVKLVQYARKWTKAQIYDRSGGQYSYGHEIVHITSEHRNPVKAAKKARKWIKQRVEADRIAAGEQPWLWPSSS